MTKERYSKLLNKVGKNKQPNWENSEGLLNAQLSMTLQEVDVSC
jgi:hypothetical protein